LADLLNRYAGKNRIVKASELTGEGVDGGGGAVKPTVKIAAARS